MASTGIPPGFRFHPTDVELIMYYLKRKVMGKRFIIEAISEINIYKYSPWDLPDKSALKNKDREWFFFCPTERKYNRGGRVNRSTENGYWKTTGKERSVLYDDRVVGMVKTLVFHQGHPPKGERTDWVFHEYRLQDQQLVDAEVVQDAFVLCKLFHKNGPGPRIGAQYGAPFDEKEWDNESPAYLYLPSGDPSAPGVVIHPPAIPSSSVLTSMGGPEVSSLGPLDEPGPSSVPPIDEDTTSLTDNDILHLLSSFTGDASETVEDGNSHEMLDHNNLENNIGDVACLEMDDIFNGLPDLPNWQAMGNQASCSISEIQPFADSFLHLGDLDTPLFPLDNLEQMPTRNCNSNGDSQLCSSSKLQPYADSFLHLVDQDTPLNSVNNLEQMPTQNYNFSGNLQLCSSLEIQSFADSCLHLDDLDTPLNSINDLEQMHAQNYNFNGDQQFYYADGSFSSTKYHVSSAQIPFLEGEFDGAGDVSNISQVYYDGTTGNDVDIMFSQPNDPTWINRFNNRD